MTIFEEVYNVFLSKITDRDLISLTENLRNDVMEGFLGSAIAQFSLCEKDLEDTNDILKQFNATLDRLEKEILSRYMVIEWSNGFIQSEEFLKQKLGSRDYSLHSPANHLDKLTELRSINTKEAKELIREYYYRNP